MIVLVSQQSIFSRIYTLNYDRLGYKSIAPFYVEDDERAATLVFVTDQ
jgi:hypothetical protein